MRILFAIHQLDFADHIALAYLSAMAKSLGHETKLVILSDADLADAVGAWRPHIVAFSANITGYAAMVEANAQARRVHDYIAIMGGPHPTFTPESFPQSGMDVYCIGEGELAFADFLNRVEAGLGYDDVPNLLTAKARNEVRPLITDLDSLPFPDRDLTLADSYLRATPKKTFYATRGCPYKCTYCCNNFYNELYRGKGPVVRRFGVERLISEIEYVQARYKMDFVKFGDDLFAIKADAWLESFAEQYRKRIGVPFNCYLRLDLVNEPLLKLLKEAGCYSVHLSIDSTSEYIREQILGRGGRKVDYVEKLRMIHGFGINSWVNFMLAAPESTLEDDLATIAMSKAGRVTYPAFSTTVPMKGTKLFDYAAQHGLIDPETHVGDMNGCSKPSTLPNMPKREKDIRYNVYLLGALAAKLPAPLDKLALLMIRHVPPNRVFEALRRWFYVYSIENRIFRLHP